jgi:hypothetical protein
LRIISRNVTSGDEIIVAAPYDRRLLEGGLLAEINRALAESGRTGNLSLAEEEADFGRGVVLTGQQFVNNLSLETLMREVRDEYEEEVLKISARQIDRRLKEKKRALKGKLYGRTKPGTLLKHAIPIKTAWREVREPGYVEIDLVAHCGPCASGEFAYSLNLTDLYTGWVETRAILGKSEGEVVKALDEMRRQLPFPLRALKSDNGSEFINHHLFRYEVYRGEDRRPFLYPFAGGAARGVAGDPATRRAPAGRHPNFR